MDKIKKSDLKELYDQYVQSGIQRWKQVRPKANDDLLFLLWATDLVLDELELTEDQIIETCRLDGKWDLKIDSGFYDKPGGKIYLIQAKHYEPTRSIGDAPFFATWESLELLSNPKLIRKANSYTKEFYIDFSEAIKDNCEVVLCVATSGRILQQQIDYIESKLKKRKIQIADSWYEVPIVFKKFDLQDLVEIERQEEVKDLTVFRESTHLILNQGWYLVPTNATGKNLYDSLYSTILAEEIIKIRKRLGPELYKLNYRGPLGDRIAVNQEILSTIEGCPDIFYVLNNGIAAICEDFSIDHNNQEITINGLQIVNGCQTVETLYHNADRIIGKSDIRVNLRLVSCRASQSSLVARATNTQTKLRAEDFATLEPIQQELQDQFSKIGPEPWYYEIKRKYWNSIISKDKSERQKYIDESGTPRIIRLRDAAQRSLSFLGEPITAAQNTAQIFKINQQGGYMEVIFPSGLKPYQILLPWMVYEHVKSEIEKYLLQIPELEQREKVREWLEYGRLTAVALVGDAFREHYKREPLQYIDNNKSKELVELIEKWASLLIKHGLNTIWNYAKEDKDWERLGPRATFRRPQTYEKELRTTFMASFHTSKDQLTSALP